jgi:hypothetical protein
MSESLSIRIQRVIQAKGPLTRRRLAQAFTRNQAELAQVLETLSTAGLITVSGEGKRSKPVIIKATELMTLPEKPAKSDIIEPADEAEWYRMGYDAFWAGNGKNKDCPRPEFALGWNETKQCKIYTAKWTRLRNLWKAGWKNAQAVKIAANQNDDKYVV